MSTILFVDDELAVLEGLRRSLWKEPFTVLTADSAAAALEILANTHVDVVVSDERMPSMSGSEFLGRVREAYPETIRIMLTGEAGLPAAVRAINEGPLYRFLHKPLSPQELLRTIRQALQMKQLLEKSTDLHRAHPAR
jgi:DNA-binding NtrC family response regulator